MGDVRGGSRRRERSRGSGGAGHMNQVPAPTLTTSIRPKPPPCSQSLGFSPPETDTGIFSAKPISPGAPQISDSSGMLSYTSRRAVSEHVRALVCQRRRDPFAPIALQQT